MDDVIHVGIVCVIQILRCVIFGGLLGIMDSIQQSATDSKLGVLIRLLK